MNNKRSLKIIGFAVMFGLSMTLPCDALNQQRDTKVEPGLSGVSIFDAASIETIINTENSVSLEKVYIDEGILGGKPVSRSEHGPRQKLVSVSTVAAIDTTKTSLEITQESQENLPGIITVSDDPKTIIREVATNNGCSEAEIDLLMKIADRESSFRTDAISPNGNCVGLFQLDANKGSKNQRLDPRYNTSKAIEYMRVRYGSIQAAYEFRLDNNWY